MRIRLAHLPIRLTLPAALLMLAACAPAPIYKTSADAVAAVPAQVSQSPENFSNRDVI